jgi:hypothetical protein
MRTVQNMNHAGHTKKQAHEVQREGVGAKYSLLHNQTRGLKIGHVFFGFLL